jgi:hypothetical protein
VLELESNKPIFTTVRVNKVGQKEYVNPLCTRTPVMYVKLYRWGDGRLPQMMGSHVSSFISGVNVMNGRPTSLFCRRERNRCIVAQWTHHQGYQRHQYSTSNSVLERTFTIDRQQGQSQTPTKQSSTRPSAVAVVRSETRRRLEDW